MPLRLVNKQRTHIINVCDTTFHIISMSIGDKEKLVYDIQNVGSDNGAFDRLLDIVAPVIARIEGFGKPTREVLSQLEDIRQLREIVHALIAHCSLTEEEIKNLRSLSEQPIPESAGNAETPAEPVGAPASTTQTQKDA